MSSLLGDAVVALGDTLDGGYHILPNAFATGGGIAIALVALLVALSPRKQDGRIRLNDSFLACCLSGLFCFCISFPIRAYLYSIFGQSRRGHERTPRTEFAENFSDGFMYFSVAIFASTLAMAIVGLFLLNVIFSEKYPNEK